MAWYIQYMCIYQLYISWLILVLQGNYSITANGNMFFYIDIYVKIHSEIKTHINTPRYCHIHQTPIMEHIGLYGLSEWHKKVFPLYNLSHWGRVTHMCVSKLTIIASDNGLSPSRRQAIIRNNAGLWSIETLATNFNEIGSKIQPFSPKNMSLI